LLPVHILYILLLDDLLSGSDALTLYYQPNQTTIFSR
jgi:hypothetical protein